MKTRLALAGALLCALALAQTGKPVYGNEVYTPIAAVPTSPTAAFSVATEVRQVQLTNTNASTTATVTIQCTTGSVVFVKAQLAGSTSTGNHLVIGYPAGLICQGGVTWSSDVSGVTGSLRAGVQ